MPKKKITQAVKAYKGKIATKSIKEMFTKKVINHIAKAAGFIQRQRKLNVYEFFFFNLRFVKSRDHEFSVLV